jgi:hypothetical protein
VGPGRNCRNDRPRTRRAEEIASRRELSVLLLVTHDLTNRHERIKHAECFMVHAPRACSMRMRKKSPALRGSFPCACLKSNAANNLSE